MRLTSKLLTSVAIGGLALLAAASPDAKAEDPIIIGAAIAQSGAIAPYDEGPARAMEVAIEEINAKGGVNGRRIEPILADGKSDNDVFAHETERLILQDKVLTIFGGWTPSNRKQMKPVLEKYDHLLLFPSRHEGMEDSQNIIYTGATPHQLILPAAQWISDKLGKRRIFFVGTDGLLGHMSYELLKDALEGGQTKIVGEQFVLVSETNFGATIKQIQKVKPDVIFNIVNGDSNLAFFRALRTANITPQDLPTISFSIGENEIGQLSSISLSGDYIASSYFESIDRPENREFVKNFKQKYGEHRGISDPMEAAYAGVYLWAKAVAACKSEEVRVIRRSLLSQSVEGPGALLRVDPSNNHTWKMFHIGKITDGNRIEIMYSSDKLLSPDPFPSTRTRAQWEALLQYLYEKWNKNWVNPRRPDILDLPRPR